MSTSQPRLAIVVAHPIHNQVPLYRRLARSQSLDVEVLFLTRHGVTSSYDRGFARHIAFDIPLLDGYQHSFIPNWSPASTPNQALTIVNPRLIEELTRRRADVVLVHGYQYVSHWIAFLACLSRRLPYLMRGESKAEDDLMRSRVRLGVKRAVLGPVLRRAAGCLAIGTRNRQFYENYGVPADRIFSAPYSVDNVRFRTSGARGRASRSVRLEALGLDPRFPVVLYAAKLLPHKRPIDLANAVTAMTAKVNLIFVGDGPLRHELANHIGDMPRTKTIGFVNQAEIGEWYGMADLFVLPSSIEPWGLVVNEAMAAGAVPVVSDAVGSGADLVDSTTGAVFPSMDTHALAQTLDRLLASPDDLEKLRREGAKRVEEFGIDATAAGIEAAVAATAGRANR